MNVRVDTIVMIQFSLKIQALLRVAGWSPARRIDISEAVLLLEWKNLPVGPTVNEFLRQCIGLRVEGHGSRHVELHPDAALAWLPDGDIQYIESFMGERACPVGYGRSLLILVGLSGHCVLLKDDWLGYIDTDGPNDALERLLIPGTYPNRWKMLEDSQRPYDCRDSK